MADDTAPSHNPTSASIIDTLNEAGAKVIDLQFSDITGGAAAGNQG